MPGIMKPRNSNNVIISSMNPFSEIKRMIIELGDKLKAGILLNQTAIRRLEERVEELEKELNNNEN